MTCRWPSTSPGHARAHSDAGACLVDVIISLGLVAMMTGIAMPVTTGAIDAARARQAAGFVAGKLRLARHQAALRGASVGLAFDRVGTRWTMRVCTDGNRNGLRRSEINSSIDRCLEAPVVLDDLFPGASVAVDESLIGPGGEDGSPDPVRFGAGDLATFSPTGTANGGTMFVRSARNVQYAVRVAGITGRTRILSYDAAGAIWRPA